VVTVLTLGPGLDSRQQCQRRALCGRCRRHDHRPLGAWSGTGLWWSAGPVGAGRLSEVGVRRNRHGQRDDEDQQQNDHADQDEHAGGESKSPAMTPRHAQPSRVGSLGHTPPVPFFLPKWPGAWTPADCDFDLGGESSWRTRQSQPAAEHRSAPHRLYLPPIGRPYNRV